MKNATYIDQQGKSYQKQALWLIVGMTLCVLAYMRVSMDETVFMPVVVSAVFSLALSTTEALVWRRVAKNSAENLPMFFTAVSGGRMLLALFTMLGYYVAVGREGMMAFLAIFAIFYVVLLVHASIFFARVSKKAGTMSHKSNLMEQ